MTNTETNLKKTLSVIFSFTLLAGAWATGGNPVPPEGDPDNEDRAPLTKPKLPKSKSEVANAKPQPPAKPSCVVNVKNTITVKANSVFDGKGCLYSWRGAGYPKKCQASAELSEKEPPMFKLLSGATLKNLQIECALDGIHTTKNNKIQNIINRDVEEDAITIGENITIENSEFWFCQDKCLQMNRGKNVTIRNNKFFHSSFPILANTGSNVKVYDNYFYNVNRAVRTNGSTSNATAENNDVQTANCYLAASNKSKIQDFGGGSQSNVGKKYCAESGGSITQK